MFKLNQDGTTAQKVGIEQWHNVHTSHEYLAWLAEGNTPEPYAPPVPTTVSRFKARAAMAQAGYFTQVDDFMSALPKTDIRRMAWEDATEFDRTSTTLKSMAEMLGLTETDLDNLFILAAGIEA